jgi:hypothetical protein
LQVSPARVATHGLLSVRVRTVSRARVTVTLQVGIWRVATIGSGKPATIGSGKHRKRATTFVVLYRIRRVMKADAHGRLTAKLRVTYKTRTARHADLTVTVQSGHRHRTRTVGVTIKGSH